MGSSILFRLNGNIDDINKTFTTPSTYVAGTLRVVWNGQVYEPDDERKGWTEIDSGTIETTEAPRTGDVLQAFYVDPTGDQPGDVVKGSPFDPNNVYP